MYLKNYYINVHSEDDCSIDLYSQFINALESPMVEFILSKDGVQREYATNGIKVDGKNGAVDIHIMGDFKSGKHTFPIRIILENKIESKESPHQTDKYFAYFSGIDKYLKDKNINYVIEKYKTITQKKPYKGAKGLRNGEIQVFIYLTAHSNYDMREEKFKSFECECQHFIHINYQDILDKILLPLVKSEAVDSRRKKILNEYIKALSFSSLHKTHTMALTKDDSKILIKFWEDNNVLITASLMALTKKDSKILIKFWEDNNALITASLEAIRNFINPEEINQELVSETIEKIKKINNPKDNSKYSINGKGEYGKRGLVDKLVSEVKKLYPRITIKEIREIFPAFDSNKESNKFEIILEKKPQDTKDYTSVELIDGKIYINSQMTLPKVKRLIVHLENLSNFPFKIKKIK